MRQMILSLCLAGLIAAPSLLAQAAGKRTPAQIRASYDAHKGEFDYLLGDWEFTSVNREYGKGRGFWSAARLSGGQILDEYRTLRGLSDTALNRINEIGGHAGLWQVTVASGTHRAHAFVRQI